jgi:hypothetical protein
MATPRAGVRRLPTIVLLAVCVVFVAPVVAQHIRALPPVSVPHGMTYGEWAAESWRALFEAPTDSYPSPCLRAQVGRVGILVASSGGLLEVDCTVAPGTTLFFPVLTGGFWCPGDCGPDTTAEDLREVAAWAIDHLDPEEDLVVELNGRRLSGLAAYRFTSPAIEGDFHADSVIGQVFGPGPYWNAVSDGYWVMMPPLPAGSHTLRYYAHLKIPEIGLDLEFETVVNLVVTR